MDQIVKSLVFEGAHTGARIGARTDALKLILASAAQDLNLIRAADLFCAPETVFTLTRDALLAVTGAKLFTNG